MAKRLHAIVAAHPELHYFKQRLQEAMTVIDSTPDIDIGRLYVVADDQVLIEHTAHYLIYGSEWIASVLGFHKDVLKKIGVPTLLEIDLPLKMSSAFEREQFATKMLREWTCLACNQPDWSAPIDFTFMLRTNTTPAHVIRHSHPKELADPLERFSTYRAPKAECAHCGP